MSNAIAIPAYYRVVKRFDRDKWYFFPGEPFYSALKIPFFYKQQDVFKAYNTTMREISIELFRINGGQQGYYLVNLEDRRYYYCGTQWENIREKLLDLGIGVRETH